MRVRLRDRARVRVRLDSDQIEAEDINNQEAYKGDKDFEPVKLPPTHNVGIKEVTLEMI